ncbi:MAG: helix-turn-helix transcriptional regulator [Proteobacteria bacterium]|nr:helix-turn-helix transcriptional regulator [Pseudomonadota bacterium]
MHTNADSRLETADEAAALLKALAHPHRLTIVCHLIDGERSVGALVQALGVGETVVSQHLAVLRRDRLVNPRRAGQTVFYSIANPAARAVVDVLEKHFSAAGLHPIDHRQIASAARGG